MDTETEAVRLANAERPHQHGYYYDRKGDALLCEPCGEKRWGEPTGSSDDVAFHARIQDTSGEWCWTYFLAGDSPCSECGINLH